MKILAEPATKIADLGGVRNLLTRFYNGQHFVIFGVIEATE